jgi:ABC-type lipoprotein release transport system permease subunit
LSGADVDDVGAIRMLAANDLRRRRGSTVAITLLIGIVGAIVIAAVAGARRSDTALARFNDESRSSNIQIEVGTPTVARIEAFERAAGSPPVGLIDAYGMTLAERENIAIATNVDDSYGTVVDRPRVIEGRLADPNALDEATISEALARQEDVTVGSVLHAVTLSPGQVARGEFAPPQGPKVRLRVVGIVRRPSDLSDLAASGGLVSLTPAFDRAYSKRLALFTRALFVRVDGEAADTARVVHLARAAFGSSDSFRVLDDLRAENHGAQSAIDVLTAALWIFAVVAAIAGLFAVGIVLFREVSRGREQQRALRSLGMTRSDRMTAHAPHAALMAGVGALLAVAGAIALSPLFPFGIARRADPDPGVHADWFALAPGAAGVVIFVFVVALAAAFRATRSTDRATARRGRPIADALGLSRLRPTVSNGVRMAFEPGRDERAVPLRSAFAGAVLGVLGVTAVLVFGASLTTLADTPRRYGWTWDFKAVVPSAAAPCDRDTLHIDRQRGVSDIAAICYTGLEIDRRNTITWSFTDLRGSIEPTIVAGRAPTADNEVALGLDTMNALRKRVGDTVEIAGSKGAQDFRVVGRVVLPQLRYGEVQHLADGATVTGAGFARVHKPDDATTRFVVARVAPGADAESIIGRVRRLPAYDNGVYSGQLRAKLLAEQIGGPTRQPEIERMQHAAWFAPTLAVLMFTLALIAVAHALVIATRRRRHELAVLKAIGFDRGQVRATLAWEASTLAIVGIALGIPFGIAVGRIAWSLVAGSIGVATTSALPALALGLLVAATLLLVNAVAYFPARAAARTRTSVALAAE